MKPNNKISRQAYADMYGPTVGDRVRLGDTDLWIEVEKDATHYGDEVKFGGGKVIRDGMITEVVIAERISSRYTSGKVRSRYTNSDTMCC